MRESGWSSLLVALCRRDATSRLDRAQLARLADPTARAGLLADPTRHGVTGLVAEALSGPPLRDRVPAVLRGELDELRRRLRRRAGMWVAERDRVLTVLSR